MKARRLVVIAVFAALPLVLTASASSSAYYHFDIDSITLSETSRSNDNGGGISEDIPPNSSIGIKRGKVNFSPLNRAGGSGIVMRRIPFSN